VQLCTLQGSEFQQDDTSFRKRTKGFRLARTTSSNNFLNDKSVSIVSRLREKWQRNRCSIPGRGWASSLFMESNAGRSISPRKKSGQDVMLTTYVYLHLIPRLKMRGAVHPILHTYSWCGTYLNIRIGMFAEDAVGFRGSTNLFHEPGSLAKLIIGQLVCK
jgi:hypothetical protein